MKLTSKMKSVAMQAKSVEELLKLAEEYGYEISKEEAEKIYAELNQEGELSDEELENVAGGGCYSTDKEGLLIVTAGNRCELFEQSSFRSGSTCLSCFYRYPGDGLVYYCRRRSRYDDPLA